MGFCRFMSLLHLGSCRPLLLVRYFLCFGIGRVSASSPCLRPALLTTCGSLSLSSVPSALSSTDWVATTRPSTSCPLPIAARMMSPTTQAERVHPFSHSMQFAWDTIQLLHTTLSINVQDSRPAGNQLLLDEVQPVWSVGRELRLLHIPNADKSRIFVCERICKSKSWESNKILSNEYHSYVWNRTKVFGMCSS